MKDSVSGGPPAGGTAAGEAAGSGSGEDVTGLLRAAEAGDRQAMDRLFTVLYGEREEVRAVARCG